jgi:small subunit ribosomal protein S9
MEKYFYAKGRRKTSVAGVRVMNGKGEITVNGKPLKEYFKWESDRKEIFGPLEAVEKSDTMFFTVRVEGGGIKGQKDAVIHGLSRALVKMDKELKTLLKAKGYMTRDDRMVERKHTGFVKARKSPQYSKR